MKVTTKMAEVLARFVGASGRERTWIFASDLPCSRSVLYRMRDAGLVEMIPFHRDTSVKITAEGRKVAASC